VATHKSEEFCGGQAFGTVQTGPPNSHHPKVDEKIPGVLLGTALLWVC